MGVLIPISGGLLFLCLGILLQRRRARFLSGTTRVNGRIIKLVTREGRARAGRMRYVRRDYQAPLVEYHYNKTYRFEAGINARRKGLTPGETIKVLIDPRRPKAAMTEITAKDSKVVFRGFQLAGLLLVVIGIVEAKPEDFDFRLDPLLIMFFLSVAVFFYIKIAPMLEYLRTSNRYFENAVEYDEENDSAHSSSE